MRDRAASALGRFRQPEYTGENRCLPCTIVNVVIAVVLAAGVAVVAPAAAVLAFVGFLLLIYLRGYLVPGTPTLTKRYLPDRVLARFDHHPAASPGSLAAVDRNATGETAGEDSDEVPFESIERWRRQRENAVDPERFLLEEGAVGPCADADDLCLTDEFATLVERELEPYRSEGGDGPTPDRKTIAAAFDVEPADVESDDDHDYPAYVIGRWLRKWPDEAALVADVATDRAFRELTDSWADVPLEQRLEMLEALRSFHDVCPRCGGGIATSSEAVESCCRAVEVVALDCRECGGRLVELDPSVADGA